MNKQNNIRVCILIWLLLYAPLVNAAADTPNKETDKETKSVHTTTPLPELIYEASEHFTDIESANLDGLLKRIGDSRVVLLGEATHGSAEFYEMRARITKELVEKKGFNIIAVEANWPDAASIDHHIRNTDQESDSNPFYNTSIKKPFTEFPTWMWANHSVLAFTHWLKDYNQKIKTPHDVMDKTTDEHIAHAKKTVGFYGLDLYDLFGSIESVLEYLQDVDTEALEAARWHYGCLLPWINKPEDYSRAMQSGRHRGCGYEMSTVLQKLHHNRLLYIGKDNQEDRQTARQRYFSALQNARLARNTERYYRTRQQPNTNAWNQRDYNMFETLMEILKHSGKTSKAVVWAHNSHVGDSRATEMSARGEFNLGQLARERFGENAYLIGFGTDHGTVIAAPYWSGPATTMQVQPSQAGSYEQQFHQVKADNFLLPLRKSSCHSYAQEITQKKLLSKRLQRAIGTTYDPKAELKKHYYHVSLADQFDEYIWIDETHAVKPITDN